MADTNFESMTPEQVDNLEAEALARVAEIQKHKEQVRLIRHEGHVKEVKALVEKYGLNVAEVFPGVRLAGAAPTASAPAAEGTKRGRKEGELQGPVSVKFRDTAGHSWKGRGMVADWLQKYQDGGGKLVDVAVPGLVWDGVMTRDAESKEMRPPKWVQMLLDEGVTAEQLKAGLHKPA